MQNLAVSTTRMKSPPTFPNRRLGSARFQLSQPCSAVLLAGLCLLALAAVSPAKEPDVAVPKSISEFFPFGIWYQGCLTDKGMYEATMAEDIHAMGINFVIANADSNLPPDSPEPTSLSSMLTLADKLGLKVLVGLSPLVKTEILRDIKTPEDFDARREELKAKLAPFVSEANKHPSLYAWWCGDEPNVKGRNVMMVAEKLRQLFVEMDPDTPSFCEGVWSVTERDVKPWLEIIKEPVFMQQVYPFWNSPYRVGIGDFRYGAFKSPPGMSTPTQGELSEAANVAGLPGFQQGAAAVAAEKPKDNEWINVDIVDQYREVRPMIGERRMWPWLQIFRERIQPGWDWRIPTPAEARCQAWIALSQGSTGLCWFGYEYLRNSGDHVQMFPEVKSIIAAVSPLTDVLLDAKVSENIATVKGGGSRYYPNALVETLRDSRGTSYLMVVNRNCEETGNSKVTVSASLPAPKRGKRWLAVDPAANAVVQTGTAKEVVVDLDMRPGEGRMLRLVEDVELKPTIEPDIAQIKVGETVTFTMTGGINSKTTPPGSTSGAAGVKASSGAVAASDGPTFARWSVVGFPAGEIDERTGVFKALKPGRTTIWLRDAGGNTAFTRDIEVVQ